MIRILRIPLTLKGVLVRQLVKDSLDLPCKDVESNSPTFSEHAFLFVIELCLNDTMSPMYINHPRTLPSVKPCQCECIQLAQA